MQLFPAKTKTKKTQEEAYIEKIQGFIFEDEIIESIHPLFLDFLCITDKRIIFVYKDLDFTEPTTSIITIPFRNINEVGLVKNDRVFALTDELVIKTRGGKYKLKFIKKPDVDIKDIYNNIIRKIL